VLQINADEIHFPFLHLNSLSEHVILSENKNAQQTVAINQTVIGNELDINQTVTGSELAIIQIVTGSELAIKQVVIRRKLTINQRVN
jgi:hypothetical protein